MTDILAEKAFPALPFDRERVFTGEQPQKSANAFLHDFVFLLRKGFFVQPQIKADLDFAAKAHLLEDIEQSLVAKTLQLDALEGEDVDEVLDALNGGS